MSSRLIVMTAAVAALALAGCGKRGVLERPDPMWGTPQEDVEVAPEGVDDNSDTEPTRPYSTSKPLDPAQMDIPIREAPVGGPSDPYGTPNGGGPG